MAMSKRRHDQRLQKHLKNSFKASVTLNTKVESISKSDVKMNSKWFALVLS